MAMRRRHLPVLGLLTLALVALIVVVPSFALAAAPTLMVFGLLSAKLFPGEELIDRLRRRVAPAARPRRAAGASRLPRPAVAVRRVGRLLAFALAVRPPPAAPASA